MSNPPTENPHGKSGGDERLPWGNMPAWLILGYGVLSLLQVSYFSYLAPDYVPLGPRLFNPLVQVVFVAAAWLLLKRRKLALALFAIHFIITLLHTATGAPELLFTSHFVMKWLLLLGILSYAFFLWRRRVLE